MGRPRASRGLLRDAQQEFPALGRAAFARWMDSQQGAAELGELTADELAALRADLLGLTLTSDGDLNTMVPADLTEAGWATLGASETNGVTTAQKVVDPAVRTGKAVWLNYMVDAGAGGLWRSYYFPRPPGTTAWEISFDGRLPDSGGPFPADFNIVAVLFSPAGAVLGNPFLTLQAGFTNQTAILPAALAGVYRLKVMMARGYTSGSSSVVPAQSATGILANLRVRPIGATGIWSGDFYRHDAERILHLNTRTGTPAWYRNEAAVFALTHSPFASLQMDTDADELGLGLCPSLQALAPSQFQYEQREGGDRGAVVRTMATVDGMQLATVPRILPGIRRVVLAASGTVYVSTIVGTFLNAVYRRAADFFRVVNPCESRKPLHCHFEGDSKVVQFAGVGSSGAPFSEISNQITTTSEPDISLSLGGFSAKPFATSNANTAQQNAQQYIDAVASQSPKTFGIQMMDNDWALLIFLAVFGAAIEAFLDAVLGPIAGPQQRDIAIWWILNYTGPVIPPGRLTTPNANGETLGQFEALVIAKSVARLAARHRFYAVPANRLLPSATSVTLPDALHNSVPGSFIQSTFLPGIIRNSVQIGWVP